MFACQHCGDSVTGDEGNAAISAFIAAPRKQARQVKQGTMQELLTGKTRLI